MSDNVTQPSKAGANPPEKMVPEGQLIALKKELNKVQTELKGQLTTVRQQLAQANSELEFAKATQDGDAEGKIKEIKDNIIRLNMETIAKENSLKEREAKIIEVERKFRMDSLAKEHGVTEEDLADCKTPEEMEMKAIKLAYAKLKENPPDKKSGNKGYEFGSSSVSKKPVEQMTDAEFAEYLKFKKAEANAR